MVSDPIKNGPMIPTAETFAANPAEIRYVMPNRRPRLTIFQRVCLGQIADAPIKPDTA